jgi:hypothetical protein
MRFSRYAVALSLCILSGIPCAGIAAQTAAAQSTWPQQSQEPGQRHWRPSDWEKITLRETSNNRPALAYMNGVLFLAWTGVDNNQLNIAVSTDDGFNFAGKYTSSETSNAAPALAATGDSLVIAWKGQGNNQINVARVNVSGGERGIPRINGFSNKVTLKETSRSGPSLASFRDMLYLAWTGQRGRMIVMASTDNGASFGGRYSSEESSGAAPALAASGDGVVIAWKGVGNHQLNVAQVNAGGNRWRNSRMSGFSNKVTLGDTSNDGPALATSDGQIFLAWTGVGNQQLNVMSSGDGGRSFGNKYTSRETSSAGPALVWSSDILLLGWKSLDNSSLNIGPAQRRGLGQSDRMASIDYFVNRSCAISLCWDPRISPG